jgi:hypothetical protein
MHRSERTTRARVPTTCRSQRTTQSSERRKTWRESTGRRGRSPSRRRDRQCRSRDAAKHRSRRAVRSRDRPTPGCDWTRRTGDWLRRSLDQTEHGGRSTTRSRRAAFGRSRPTRHSRRSTRHRRRSTCCTRTLPRVSANPYGAMPRMQPATRRRGTAGCRSTSHSMMMMRQLFLRLSRVARSSTLSWLGVALIVIPVLRRGAQGVLGGGSLPADLR